jgi:glycine/D-amino acid oxidase-like deaminating enzyme
MLNGLFRYFHLDLTMTLHVAVIGAGIVGLSTAVLAQEAIPGVCVTLISEHFSPDTTGDGSAGLWMPYCLKDTPQSKIV